MRLTVNGTRGLIVVRTAAIGLFIPCLLSPLDASAQPPSGRQTISLDGTWDIAESVRADALPTQFSHRVPVPGLVHSSLPAFADVDRFSSREYLSNQVVQGRLPQSALTATAGVSQQARNYFWYRTRFLAPTPRAIATLIVNKAQFGSEVWINGKHLGGSPSCSTSHSYELTKAIRWSRQNDVLIRIGAHPGAVPEPNTCGVDFEKERWTPGIYDSVSVVFTGAMMIKSVQVAPKVDPRQITVQAKLYNSSSAAIKVPLQFNVHGWRKLQSEGNGRVETVVEAGETKTVLTTIPLPLAKLWSPEEPNLYEVETKVDGDNVVTRFGVRELRFDTATRRAYLNGKPYFLRGSNVTLHRFFESPESGQLPWNDAWVRKLLGERAQQMHWNFMRFCIGPVPQHWLDVADENGLMIQYEYPIWVFSSRVLQMPHVKSYDAAQLIPEFANWMQDAWNHPSVVLWDASNESDLPILAEKVIPAVRGLDLSGRQWENSYNPPEGPDDPVEDHPYEFVSLAFPGLVPEFDMTKLETRNGAERFFITPPTGHPLINNEYGWLWLDKAGNPTLLTKNVYPNLPYPHATAKERLSTQAYLLAGLTEYWRAYRNYAAVMHFVYLSGGEPGSFTTDNFANVATLEFQPEFADYVGEAFKPLGVYVNFWQPQLPAGGHHDFQVMMVNDAQAASTGKLSLVLEAASGQVVTSESIPYAVQSSGQQTYYLRLELPATEGSYLLKAVAKPDDGGPADTTTSRRRLSLVSSH